MHPSSHLLRYVRGHRLFAIQRAPYVPLCPRSISPSLLQIFTSLPDFTFATGGVSRSDPPSSPANEIPITTASVTYTDAQGGVSICTNVRGTLVHYLSSFVPTADVGECSD